MYSVYVCEAVCVCQGVCVYVRVYVHVQCSVKCLWVHILVEMPADLPRRNFCGFHFSSMQLPNIDRAHLLLTFKLHAVFVLVVYEPSTKTAKMCTMLKFPTIQYVCEGVCMYVRMCM